MDDLGKHFVFYYDPSNYKEHSFKFFDAPQNYTETCQPLDYKHSIELDNPDDEVLYDNVFVKDGFNFIYKPGLKSGSKFYSVDLRWTLHNDYWKIDLNTTTLESADCVRYLVAQIESSAHNPVLEIQPIQSQTKLLRVDLNEIE